jgi:protein TonB
MTRPVYPQEAFIKKIEGIVELEILIDASGKVVRARVIRSIPLLDAAAIQTVYQWVFEPALKNGRPVATLASAPVGFRIY